MNYKIDYNFLEITNSPSIEYYFEKQAREGWLIERVYLGSLFIFKKVEPIELDFSIQPFELASEGWNYVTESYDLHIYYKEYKAEAPSLKLAPVEEFEILEEIGKKRFRSTISQIFFFVILGILNLGGIYTSTDFLKDGAAQLTLPLVLTGLTIAIWGIIHIRRFLKRNRENVEAGREIEYSESLFLVPSATFFLGTIVLVLLAFHFIYLGIISRAFIPFVLILIISSLFILEKIYRFWKKSDKTNEDRKKMNGLGTMLVLFLVAAGFGIYQEAGMATNPNLEEYKVLTVDTFPTGQLEIEGTLTHNFSILIPKSYAYYYISDESEYVETEYSRALIPDFAKDLTTRYIDEAKREYHDVYQKDIQLYFEEDTFNDDLLNAGISEGDLIRLKNLNPEEAEETVQQLILERSITETNAEFWNADDAYFMSYNKDTLLIRKGREVFYIIGKDFTNPLIINRTKEKLAFN